MIIAITFVLLSFLTSPTRAQTCQANILDCPSAGAEGTLFEICGIANLAVNATTVNLGTGASVVNLGTVETLTSNDPFFFGRISTFLGSRHVVFGTSMYSNLNTGSAVTPGYDTDTGNFIPGKNGIYHISTTVYFHDDEDPTAANVDIYLNEVRLARALASETRESLSITAKVRVTDPTDYISVRVPGRDPHNAYSSLAIHRIPNV